MNDRESPAATLALDRRALEFRAACAALGLDYWAEARLAGHCWAVRDGVYVLVRVNRSAGLCWLAGTWSGPAEECTYLEETVATPWTLETTL